MRFDSYLVATRAEKLQPTWLTGPGGPGLKRHPRLSFTCWKDMFSGLHYANPHHSCPSELTHKIKLMTEFPQLSGQVWHPMLSPTNSSAKQGRTTISSMAKLLARSLLLEQVDGKASRFTCSALLAQNKSQRCCPIGTWWLAWKVGSFTPECKVPLPQPLRLGPPTEHATWTKVKFAGFDALGYPQRKL